MPIRGRKTRALLAYIALNENGAETRERLVGLCWSESEEAKARGSLRQALRELRQALQLAGFDGLHADKEEIALDLPLVESDVWAAIGQAEALQVHPLLLNTPRVMDALLQGFDDIDPSYRIWLLARRQTLHERLQRGLEAGLAHDRATPEDQARIAQAIINLDPTHEEACRHLMRWRAATGDIGGALRVYKTLWDLLDEEYGMEPSPQTQALVAEIKNGGPLSPPGGEALALEPERPAAPARAAEAPPVSFTLAEPAPRISGPDLSVDATPRGRGGRIVLAVEPFFLEGIGGERVHLVQGFRHSLIACLVRFREWCVTERSSPTAPIAANDGGNSLCYAVQATAFQSGDRVNVILTLKEIATDMFVWSDRFELSMERWFDVQQHVVSRITTALNVHLSAERLMRVAAEPDVSLDLYDRWLRGQSMILNFTPDDWSRATQLFRSVIEEAPRFAPAYSSLVQLGNTAHIAHPGVFRAEQRQHETLSLAKTAARLDPIDSRAQLCLGWAYAYGRQYDQALLHFGLACDLNDHDPWTLISVAQGQAFLAEFDRARKLGEQAVQTSFLPTLSHWGYHAGIRFFCGDYEGALDAARQAGDSLFNNRAWRAAALHHLGRRDEAVAEGRHCLEFIRANWRGEAAPTDQAIGRWILQLFPIRRTEDWERLRQGLAGAGIPTDGARHPA